MDEGVDVADFIDEDIEVEPGVDYNSREEGDDAGFSASQLDLF